MSLWEDFNTNGYVVLTDLRGKIDSMFTEENLLSVYNVSVHRYMGFLRTAAKTVDIQKLILAPHILKMLRQLGVDYPSMPTQPVLHAMSPALTIPDGYDGTVAHQDWPSIQGSIDMVTVWIALTDAQSGRYPLEVVPGSHLKGVRDGVVNGSVLECELYGEEKFIPIECMAGDVVFLSGFLVHRTGEGDTFRAAVSQRFDSNIEPTFIERGFPCAQKRVVDRTMIWTPSVEQIKAVYAVD